MRLLNDGSWWLTPREVFTLARKFWFIVFSNIHDRHCPCGWPSDEWSAWVQADGPSAILNEHRSLVNDPRTDATG